MTAKQVRGELEQLAIGLAINVAPPRVRRLWAELAAFLERHAAATWVGSAIACLLLLRTNPPEGQVCLEKLIAEVAFFFIPVLRRILDAVVNYILGGQKVACVTTHKSSQKVQGPGLCCAQVGVAGGLVPPPAGTTLPAYLPGQADAGQIPAGRIVQVTTATGKCGSCMIVGSTSKKHPGKPVLKFIPGGPACPTAGTGCCAL